MKVRNLQNSLAMSLLWLSGFIILGLLLLFLGYILYKGLPVLSLSFVFGVSSDLKAGGGVGSQLFNSFYLLFYPCCFRFRLRSGRGSIFLNMQ